MLADVLGLLACPHCGLGLDLAGPSARCATGHTFDLAKQGYLSLLAGDAGAGTGDTAAMVAARADFLGAGHYRPIGEAIAEALGGPVTGPVVDLGAGTGHYLAQVLDRSPAAVGLALDLSKFALRRAARVHPRAGAVVCDAWRGLPVRDGVAAVLLNVFAPRNGPEMARILAPGGRLVVVTPETGHLGALVDELGLLRVDADKGRRVDEQLGTYFTQVGEIRRRFRLGLSRAEVATVVGMGPNAWHTDPAELAGRIATLPEPYAVNAQVRVGVYRSAAPALTGPG
ncbi:putative RNA methyltransferase [Crossiella cryophila]|uniref:23S rRNA (Guanine745-N1)-methyltransferase n=1 Tax=Crossiella cryophila TaxID=43355 RepID=A0A7W7FY70_9PSEU|nr:23S rRNA methyltransferase [Crossiella cryophila]MBB4681398.1 23S rRNA (guanine745-N1)-methyltransferase [Crossiella cryophila]